MNQSGRERDIEQACLLLDEYSFDLGGYLAPELVCSWQKELEADPSWIRSAVVEALYQGRYKARSVEQILRVWKRRGHPLRHFNHDFERVVFGPVDAMASKYASMTTLRPSAFLTSQSEGLIASNQSESPSTTEPAAAIASTLSPAPESALSPAPESAVGGDRVVMPMLSSPAVVGTAVEGSLESLLDSAMAIAVADPDPARSELAKISDSNPESFSTFIPLSLPETTAASATAETQASKAAPIQSVQAESTSAFHSPEPIRKFVPQPEPSGFYARLQSVVRHL